MFDSWFDAEMTDTVIDLAPDEPLTDEDVELEDLDLACARTHGAHGSWKTARMWIVGTLLYGAGLRLQECLELRVKDVDFDRNQLLVRRGKGQKDRRTMLPEVVKDVLRAHLGEVKTQHERDLIDGVGRVVLPFALDRKYPRASTEWGWQFVLPAARICREPAWGPPSRFHLHESAVQKAVARAAREAGMTKRVGPHTSLVRDAFAGGRLRHPGRCRSCWGMPM